MPRVKKKMGRPPELDEKQTETLIHLICTGTSITRAAIIFRVARNTIKSRLRQPGVRERIAEWKAQLPEIKEQAIREWDEVQDVLARRRKPRTAEQIMALVEDVVIEERTPPPAPVTPPEPPKPEVVYQPLYLVPPVQPVFEGPKTLYPRVFSAPDWRKTLPIPDAARTPNRPRETPRPKTHGYGSPVRSNWPR